MSGDFASRDFVSKREYLRDKYQDKWAISNEREKYVAGLLEKSLGAKVNPNGFGAMSTERFYGPTKKYGFYAGEPDLHVEGIDVFVEVTGPILPYVSVKDDLFINPSKMRNALHKDKENVWLVHYLPKKGVREDILSLLDGILSPDVLELIKTYCLTDTARCVLGKLSSRVKKEIAAKEVLAERTFKFHVKKSLVDPRQDEFPVLRCIHLSKKFINDYINSPRVRLGDCEEFVPIPAGDGRVISFAGMIKKIKENNNNR